MKPGLAVPIFLMMVLFCTVGVGRADLSEGQKMAAEALIEQLSDRRFAVRQQAVDRLAALGPDVVPLVKKTLAETDDNEVKLRCRMVIKRIAEEHGIPIDADGHDGTAVAFEASTVTINVTDVPLSEVLQRVSEASGNAVIDADDKLRDQTLTLSVEDMPYWDCLDRICRETGSIYTSDHPCGRLRMTRIEGARDVGVRAGPVAVKVLRAYRSRRFRTPRTPMVPGQPGGSGVSYQLVYWWEDRLPVVASHGRVTRATTARGEVMVTREPTSAEPAGTVAVFLRDVPKDVTNVVLEGEITLELAAGVHMTRLRTVLAAKGKTIVAGGVRLKLIETAAEPNAVLLTLRPEDADRKTTVPDYRTHRLYGFFLEDARGGRFPAEVTAPAGARTDYVLRFVGLPGEPLTWSLVYAAPARRVRKVQPFRMTGLPVP